MRYLVLLLALLVATPALAVEYEIAFRSDNRWVHKDDRTPLNAMISYAKQKNITKFKVVLPKEKRDVQIERLIVIRDQLSKSLKSSIVIEETEGKPAPNRLIFSF